MTYAELIAEIKGLSNRYDSDDKVAIALRMTTLRAHNIDDWWRDLVEVQATFANAREVAIDISNTGNFPFFKKLSNIRYYDPVSGALGNFLDEIDPTVLMDTYKIIQDDKYYLAGTNLNIRFATATTGAQIAYYKLPDTSAATYNSWIATLLPDLLVQGSLAYLLNRSGNQEEARAINRMVGFEVDPANRAPGFTLVQQLQAMALRATA